MIVGVPKETYPGERRVALIPDTVGPIRKKGHEVLVEKGAGLAAGFLDQAYEDKGATIVADRGDLFAKADVILQVRSLGSNPDAGKADLEMMREGQIVIGSADPLGNPQAAQLVAKTGVTAFALELVPRITRAQSMDILSSMATVAGYKAVLWAAEKLPKFFPMFMTAAGTISPARVFVIGAGVAGLQAIATAKRLGAVVHAYDVRPAVKEQVESLGGKFVEMELETEDAQDAGGYKMPPEWVNMVQRTQTSHLPDPFDATAVEQGIGVYYCNMNYAGISFAIIEDRKFKSAPKMLLPDAKVQLLFYFS